MRKRDIQALLKQLGVRSSRRLGQHFLHDANMLDFMVRAAAPRSGERVLEIGPGTGQLTRRLLAAGCRVTAVEIDHRLADYLDGELGVHSGFDLVRADACRLDYDELMGSEPYRCLANLPYSISSVFLAEVSGSANPPQELFVLLQQEMADRFLAAPGTKAYGSLAVRVGLVYDVELIRRLPPEVFMPPPEVSSAYVRLALREPQLRPELRRAAARVARTAFAQRRKRAAKLLSAVFGAPRVQAAFAAVGIDPNARAETMSVETIVRLTENLDSGPHEV